MLTLRIYGLSYNPTDNAGAERMNGILKVEWIYRHPQYADRKEAEEEIKKMIKIHEECQVIQKAFTNGVKLFNINIQNITRILV